MTFPFRQPPAFLVPPLQVTSPDSGCIEIGDLPPKLLQLFMIFTEQFVKCRT